jgi:hypothetical protein
MPPFAIRKGSRVVMKAKEGAKGTVLEASGKYIWKVKWDDGKIRPDYKSQQLKAEPRADTPPASVTISGTIPGEIGHLSQLTRLDLGRSTLLLLLLFLLSPTVSCDF